MNKQKVKLIPVLGGLLAAQLLLALVLGLNNSGSAFTDEPSPLITADIASIDRIRIEDQVKNVATLEKAGEKWQVSEVSSFPVDDERMTKLLESLTDLRRGWPIATTDEAAERFKVAPKAFERKVVLYKQDAAVAELFVGNAAAFRKSHLRLGGESDIIVADINTYEVYSRPDEWIDKEILQQEPDRITSVKLPGLTLERSEQGLSISGLKSDQQTNAEQAGALLNKIANLKIQEVLGTENKPVYRQSKPSHTISLILQDGSSIDYTISQPKDETYYVLKSSTRPEYFKVPTYTLDPIFDTKRDQLVEAKPPQPEENKAS